jgi:hypothetical protein
MQLICEGHVRIAPSPHVQLVMNKPVMLEQPVLQGGTDVDAAGCSIYGTVLRDGGRFRMWYQAWPRDWDLRDVTAVACAESDDGLNWRRPAHGIVERGGSTANHLTDLPVHCPSVFIDPHADGAARYRAIGSVTSGEKPFGYYAARSSDGLHWELDAKPLWPHADVVTSAWDAAHDCALVAMKGGINRGGLSRRSFFLSEWSRGTHTPPALTWAPDELDDLNARSRGFTSADYYGLGLMPTSTETAFGFLWNFRHMTPLREWGDTGRVDLSLVYRTDRWGAWQHVTGRPDWFSAEEAPEWARGALYTASTPIDVGDETWLYVTGSRDRHGAVGLRKYEEVMKDAASLGGWSRIGLLKWRRDRLLGYTALWDGLVTLTASPAAGLSHQSDVDRRLELNLQTRPGGSVRVRLFAARGWSSRPLDGFDFDDCDPIAGDHSRAGVRWRSRGDALPRVEPGEVLKAEVKLDRATLWAFDFVS